MDSRHAGADAQTLRKTLVDAAVAAAEIEPERLVERALARARVDGDAQAERLGELFADPDWVTPPSARRRIAGALAYFGTPECLPEAARAVPEAALIDFVADGLDAELEAWESFRRYRDGLRTRREEERERKLYARRRKLRAELQSR